MKTLLITSISMILAIASFSQSNTEKEITTLSEKRVKWLLAGKIDSLATIYDENSLTVHSNGMVKTTAEHFNDIKNGRPVYKTIDIKEVTVKDFGTTATLVGKGMFNITMNGSDMSFNMVYTEVYQKRNKKWKLIARHANSIQ